MMCARALQQWPCDKAAAHMILRSPSSPLHGYRVGKASPPVGGPAGCLDGSALQHAEMDHRNLVCFFLFN